MLLKDLFYFHFKSFYFPLIYIFIFFILNLPNSKIVMFSLRSSHYPNVSFIFLLNLHIYQTFIFFFTANVFKLPNMSLCFHFRFFFKFPNIYLLTSVLLSKCLSSLTSKIFILQTAILLKCYFYFHSRSSDVTNMYLIFILNLHSFQIFNFFSLQSPYYPNVFFFRLTYAFLQMYLKLDTPVCSFFFTLILIFSQVFLFQSPLHFWICNIFYLINNLPGLTISIHFMRSRAIQLWTVSDGFRL